MENPNELTELIIEKIRQNFTSLQTVADYAVYENAIQTPACFVEFEQAELSKDVGTEQLPMTCRVIIRLILGFNSPTVQKELRNLSISMANFIHQNRWGHPDTSPAKLLGCYPDDFEPNAERYKVWKVEFEQDVLFGQSIWTNEGVIPTEITIGETNG